MRGRIICLAIVAALPGTAAHASSPDHAGARPDRIVRDVVYLTIGDRPLHLDLYIHPDATPKRPGPVLVHFHGGGWARGARPSGWGGFRPWFAAGFSVATVEYRLAGEARAPAAVQDARCALHWIGANADRLGFDTRRMIVSGTSSGGHLALMAGLLPDGNDVDVDACRTVPKAAAIVDFYGPSDLTAVQAGSGARHPTVANWIGSDARAATLERAMSPVTHVAADSPPVFIVHGDADQVVPLEQSVELKKRLDAASVPSELFVVPGGGHGRFDAASQNAMMARLFAFLCGRQLPSAKACGVKN